MHNINTKNLQQLIRDSKVDLLDVRTDMEYRSGHISGARHIPVDTLETMSDIRPPAEGRTLCLICQSGKRAERARQHLENNCGISACILEQGMNAWQEAGLPIIREKSAPLPLIRQVQIIIGLVNLITIALGYLITPLWLIIPAFTSCGLLIAGLSGTCGLALLLARMPWNRP